MKKTNKKINIDKSSKCGSGTHYDSDTNSCVLDD